MITEHDLQEAIAECEGQRNPSSSTCLKLAAFYTIKDKLYPNRSEPREPVYYSSATEPKSEPIADEIEYIGNTEFAKAIKGMSVRDFTATMDELMSTLKVLVPRLYDGVMRKIDPTY